MDKLAKLQLSRDIEKLASDDPRLARTLSASGDHWGKDYLIPAIQQYCVEVVRATQKEGGWTAGLGTSSGIMGGAYLTLMADTGDWTLKVGIDADNPRNLSYSLSNPRNRIVIEEWGKDGINIMRNSVGDVAWQLANVVRANVPPTGGTRSASQHGQ